MTGRVYTPAEAAAHVGASEKFVRDLCRQRAIPHLRVGRGAVRFTEDHLSALVEHLTLPAKPAAVSTLTTSRSRARRSS